MKTDHIKNLLLLSLLLLGPIRLSLAACNQTLSAGANVASAISGTGGTTICLHLSSTLLLEDPVFGVWSRIPGTGFDPRNHVSESQKQIY
ncbi:MAG: hypothetical protein M3461_22990 [Pseudomonadota bacterium]|nr:hypothetical protein [Pseudomonadota bacterium]